MKHTIENNAARVFHFSFCGDLGRTSTIMIPPGKVSVSEKQLLDLRKLDLFLDLETKKQLTVMSAKAVETVKATVKTEVVEAKVTETKVPPKPKKVKAKPKTKSANMDLEDL